MANIVQVAIGADHGGASLKDELMVYLNSINMSFVDVGTFNGAKVFSRAVQSSLFSFKYSHDRLTILMLRSQYAKKF